MHKVRQRRGHQRGLSVVELMVGIAVGLFVVSAAVLMISTQLGDTRRLLLETQLQQDLRAASDIIARELRRASAWGSASMTIWRPGQTTNVTSNPFGAVTAQDEGAGIDFRYQRRPGEEGPYGFMVAEGGILKSRLGLAGWQELTDADVMNVTQFNVELTDERSDPLPCPTACADGTTDCWPRVVTRTARIDIAAQARSDSQIQRTVTTYVRLRNDKVEFNNGADICP